MLTGTEEAALRLRLKVAGIDVDATNLILKTARRTDVPTALGGDWAASWDGKALDEFAALDQADRQHALERDVTSFLQDPVKRVARAHCAAQSGDDDLRTAGELAVDLSDLLTAFGHDVRIPHVSAFTGKTKYRTLTDLDVATAKAIVEVTTQSSAGGKVAQLAVLLGPEANPARLPVFYYTPNLDPASVAAQSLRRAGSSGVFSDRAALVAVVRALR